MRFWSQISRMFLSMFLLLILRQEKMCILYPQPHKLHSNTYQAIEHARAWNDFSIVKTTTHRRQHRHARASVRTRPSPPLNPHYNRPSDHWPCVKSCLVGGCDKYRQHRHADTDQNSILLLRHLGVHTSKKAMFIVVAKVSSPSFCLLIFLWNHLNQISDISTPHTHSVSSITCTPLICALLSCTHTHTLY